MTQVCLEPRTTHITPEAPARRQPAASDLLREMAYVLQLTQRVKAEILSDPPAHPSGFGRDR